MAKMLLETGEERASAGRAAGNLHRPPSVARSPALGARGGACRQAGALVCSLSAHTRAPAPPCAALRGTRSGPPGEGVGPSICVYLSTTALAWRVGVEPSYVKVSCGAVGDLMYVLIRRDKKNSLWSCLGHVLA